MSAPGFATPEFQEPQERLATDFIEEIEALSAPFLALCPDTSTLAYSRAQAVAQAVLIVLPDDAAHGAEVLYGFGLALGSAAAQSGGRDEVCRQNVLNGFRNGLRQCRAADRGRS